jgi:hypothetical protein
VKLTAQAVSYKDVYVPACLIRNNHVKTEANPAPETQYVRTKATLHIDVITTIWVNHCNNPSDLKDLEYVYGGGGTHNCGTILRNTTCKQ